MARRAARELCGARERARGEGRIAASLQDTGGAQRSGWWAIVALVLCTAALNFALMPGEFLAGDPHAWREETRSLLLRGELSVPDAYAQRFGEPGQYFVRNEHTGLYYSKYGLANVLFTLPPMWLQQATGADLTGAGRLPSLFLFNLWYIALAALLAAMLFRLAGGYTRFFATRLLFVVGVLYCTFLWFYQRAQASELYQVILFTAFYMSLVAFLRRLAERSPRGLEPSAWASLGAAWLFAGLLVFTRVIYGLLLPLVVLLTVYALARPERRGEPLVVPRALVIALLAPPVLIIGLLGAVNFVKFGAPWLTGYHQWRPELHAPVGRIADGLWGFLFSPRFSIFLYFPLLAFALLGFTRFVQRHRVDAVAMLAIFMAFLLVVSSLPSWAGEWTYGPRYLLFVLPVLSLPFLTFIDGLIERRHSSRAWLWTVTVVAALGHSAYLQVQVNRLPFFAYYNARVASGSPELIGYFYDRHVGVICDDLVRHRHDFDGLPFFADLKRAAPPEFLNHYRVALGALLARDNVYWALPPAERR